MYVCEMECEEGKFLYFAYQNRGCVKGGARQVCVKDGKLEKVICAAKGECAFTAHDESLNV